MKKLKCVLTLLRIATITLAMIVLFSKPYLAADKSATIEKHNLSLSTPYGSLIVNLSIKPGSYKTPTLTGDVTNGTDRAWRYVSFKIVLLDKNGDEIQRDSTDIMMEGSVQATELKKNGTSVLTDSLRQSFTFRNVSWKKVSDIRIQFDGSASFYDSKYVFALVKPSLSEDLAYEDKLVKVQFSLEGNGIHCSLQNKSDSPIVLDWDKASYVDFSGQSHRVIHAGVRLIDRDKPQAPSLIPPTARIEDEAFPVDNISWDSYIKDWIQVPLLPPSQDAIKYKGQSFSVFLPLKIGDKEKSYLFTIQIKDVVI